MKLRVLIAAHMGLGGHICPKFSQASVVAHFFWCAMTTDVEEFVRSCLHYLCTASGNIVPRTLEHALHATEMNKLLHFDFCYMSQGTDDFIYVLVLRDDLSWHVWLEPTKAVDEEIVASVLIHWLAAFGVVTDWVSDREIHFKNELIRLLRESIKSSHHFTLAYCL